MPLPPGGYIGRFAPSPTRPPHAGPLVAAPARWLDPRAPGGPGLVRIEDIDPPRCSPGADLFLLQQLAACGLHPDQPPVWQSQRHTLYAKALQRLIQAGLAYGCACTRKEIEAALQAQGVQRARHQQAVYPGTCRQGNPGRAVRAWRLEVEKIPGATDLHWQDRRLGPQAQNVATEVGDFVLQRADGLWAYQLAVVVDDAAQGVTDIVRGADLCDNTARQILLQRALGLPTPRYLHTPLVLDERGEKLSKQHGAPAIDTRSAASCLAALRQAAQALGLPDEPTADAGISDQLLRWTAMWRARWG